MQTHYLLGKKIRNPSCINRKKDITSQKHVMQVAQKTRKNISKEEIISLVTSVSHRLDAVIARI